MTHADLTAVDWAERSDVQATHLAQEIAARHDLRLVQVRWHEYAGRRHRLALFDRGGIALSLVPGGRTTLGYDGGRFQPTPAQAASYAASVAALGLPALAKYVDAVTSPQRRVDLPAMLVAAASLEPVASDVHHNDPNVRERILYGNDTYSLNVSRVGADVVRLDASHVATPLDELDDADDQVGVYGEAVARVTRLGLRLSTPDEWEFACGAEAQTLWRWGDDTPEAGYPYDHDAGSHRELNLWGRAIGQDPYKHEWTTQRTRSVLPTRKDTVNARIESA